MLLKSKYWIWYNKIIDKALLENRNKKDDYYERHHIVPKSLGGTDDENNLVLLTAREHFICHYLLTKFTNGKQKSKMIFALNGMRRCNDKQKRYINSHLYENNKKEMSKIVSKRNTELFSGSGNPMYGKSTSKYVKEFWDNVSEDWKEKRNKKVSEGTKKAMTSLSEEKKREMLINQMNNQCGYQFLLVNFNDNTSRLFITKKEMINYLKNNPNKKTINNIKTKRIQIKDLNE